MVQLAAQLRRAGLVGLVGAASIVAGCGGSDTSSDDAEPATRDEYMQAANEAVACIQAAGLSSSTVEQGDGSIAISIGTTAEGPAADAEIDRVHDQCTEEYTAVGQSYMSTIRPDPEDAIRETIACLVGAGYLEPGDGLEEYQAMMQEQDEATGGQPGEVIGNCISAPYSTATTLGG